MKSKTTAAILCIFLGSLGVHRFYLGYKLFGIIQSGCFVRKRSRPSPADSAPGSAPPARPPPSASKVPSDLSTVV